MHALLKGLGPVLRDYVRFCVQRKNLLQLRASVAAVAAGVVTVVATSSVVGLRGNCNW